MTLHTFRSTALETLALSVLCGLPFALAQPAAHGPRIRSSSGEAWIYRGATGDRVPAAKGATLAARDRIATRPNARAEVQLDPDHSFRVDRNAEVYLAELENGPYRMNIVRGALTWQARQPRDRVAEIETPSVSVRPSRAGVVEIVVGKTKESEIIARKGDVEVFAPGGSEWVYAGQKMIARGPSSAPEFRITAASRWGRITAAIANMASISANAGSSDSGSTESVSSSASESTSQSGQSSQPAPVSRTTESISRGTGNSGSRR